MQKITTFLWFDDKAEEALNLYVSTFKNSKITGSTRYGENSSFPAGTMMWATFELEGQEFMALNGGPMFKFTPAISLFVNCETQEEVDILRERLSEGGEKQNCGWVKDKYGLSWQIIPTVLSKYMRDKDPEKAGRVMNAMMQMYKIDIQKIEEAYDNE